MTTSPRYEWRIPAGLIALSLVPAIFGSIRLAELARGAEITASNARFFESPWPVALHIVSVIPYSILGAFQFAPGFRSRKRGWHRAAGRILVILGCIAALSGLWMTLFYPWPAGDGELLYAFRLLFGSAMLAYIILAVGALGKRDFVRHGEWMIRGYAIGLGAGTQVLTHLPWRLFVGAPDETIRALLMGAGWAINCAVAEVIIRRARRNRHTPSRRLSITVSRVVAGGEAPVSRPNS